MSNDTSDYDVAIVGGGPCGLVLAHELGRRHIRTVLLNDRSTTSPYPQAGATQARTMEHYRRLGIADRVRAAGLPSDWPTDVLYTTRYAETEIARLSMPASKDAGSLVKKMTGSCSAAELPHRCSQMLVERILYDEAKSLETVDLRFGSRVTSLSDDGDRVTLQAVDVANVETSVSARYVVGADAARGVTRSSLGVKYAGETSMDRPFLSGLMLSVYFRSTTFYELVPHAAAWQYWAINPQRRGMTISLNGRDEFVFVTQLRPGEEFASLSDDDVRKIMFGVMGREYEVALVSRAPWTAGLALVADAFRVGRVFLAGDAAHLFTPTGGLGYNTAVDDAVNLGWKLAGVIDGWGGETLLDSYELERQPLARRNVGYASVFADSMGRFAVPAAIEEEDAAGDAARREAGDYLLAHARKEFNIPGITFGGRYDGSPLIVSDGIEPPADSASEYVPTACPGGRAPHAWLSDGRSLYDAFGFDFTLLILNRGSNDHERIAAEASARGIPLVVLDVTDEKLSDLYEADLALIRPDQIVCWRGSAPGMDVVALFDRVTGQVSPAAQLAVELSC